MRPGTNMTMVEALRLTRAGRLTEAAWVLQRGLASAGTAAADGSTVTQPFGDSATSEADAKQPPTEVARSAPRCCRVRPPGSG